MAWRRQQFNLSHLCIISNQQPFSAQGHCTQRSSDLVFVYDNLRRPPELSLRTCESAPSFDNGDLRTCCIASSVSNRGARRPKPWRRSSSSFQEHGESLRKVVYVNSSRSTRFGKSQESGVSLSSALRSGESGLESLKQPHFQRKLPTQLQQREKSNFGLSGNCQAFAIETRAKQRVR